MSTDDGADDGATLTGSRICSDCQGFGRWDGDRSDGELIVECATCGRRWSAPDRTEGGAGQ